MHLPRPTLLLLLAAGACYDEKLSSIDERIAATRGEIAAVQQQQLADRQRLDILSSELPGKIEAVGQRIDALEGQLTGVTDLRTELQALRAEQAAQAEALAALQQRQAELAGEQRRDDGQPQLAALGGVMILSPLLPLLWLRQQRRA